MWDLIVSVPDHCLSFYFPIVRWGGFHAAFKDWESLSLFQLRRKYTCFCAFID